MYQSPPANLVAAAATSSSSYNADFTNVTSGLEATAGASPSSYESSNYGAQQGASSFSGFESAQGGSGGFGSSYDSSSFALQGGAGLGDAHASGYQNYNASSGGNIDLANTAFNAADINRDGSIDPNEFRQFLTSHSQYVYRF